jgi:cysteine synthase B
MAAESLQNKPCGGRYGDIVQSIGHTPLIELKRLSPKPGVRIWAKLESRNPTGSVKDRVARALIEDAEDKGLIGPGQTLLEPTSGNTGISLAMICGRKGYDLKVVMPENVTPERTELLRMYGAEIVYSEGSKGSNGAVEKALDMAEKDASYYMPYQYGNPANPDAHYNGTALEILEELDDVSAFVAGLGTGGTLMGNGRRLKEELGDDVKIVAAEPMQGEPVQGLRSLEDGFIPPIIDLSLLDRKIFVTNHDAIVWTRKLMEEERLFAGVSSGAIARVAVRIAGELDEGNVVFVVCDDGWKYLSSGIYAPSKRSRTWTPPSGGNRGRAGAGLSGAAPGPAQAGLRRGPGSGRVRRGGLRVGGQDRSAVGQERSPVCALRRRGPPQRPARPRTPYRRRLHGRDPAAPASRGQDGAAVPRRGARAHRRAALADQGGQGNPHRPPGQLRPRAPALGCRCPLTAALTRTCPDHGLSRGAPPPVAGYGARGGGLDPDQ